MTETINRYLLCNQQAEQAKVAKREVCSQRGKLSPEGILDLDDIIYGSSRAWAIARREFKSLPGNPHTKNIDIPMGQMLDEMDVPRAGILNMLEQALQSIDADLTRRQRQALEAYDEAIHADLPFPTNYVAEQLGIKRDSALKLIKRAKMSCFDDFAAYICSSVHKLDDWSPPPKQVTAMMKSKPRMCAYCGGKTYDGSVPLCFECHSKLGSLREEKWDKRTRSWLPDEINRIRREHRQWAIDQCYRAHYGTVSIEEYECLMDAA